MVKEDKGRFRTASKGKTGIIYIPSDMVKDSAFPLQDGAFVKIKIEARKLIIEQM